MGFLDRLLGRKTDDSGMQTAPPPATMPDADDHSHDEGEHDHSHEGHSHEDDAGGPPA